MSYCSQCGYKLADAAKFCGGCGAQVLQHEKPQDPDRAYRRTALKISPDASANFFAERVLEMINRQASREQSLQDLFGDRWEANPQFFKSDFPHINPHPESVKLLLTGAEELVNIDRDLLMNIHNYAVLALRFMCNEEVRKNEIVKVRDGLRIPRDWQVHYENLLTADSPVLILASVQHAFTGNPLEGELYEWSNHNGGFFGGRGNKVPRTVLGLSVAGAAAALLLG